jgi:hypothetical protein
MDGEGPELSISSWAVQITIGEDNFSEKTLAIPSPPVIKANIKCG